MVDLSFLLIIGLTHFSLVINWLLVGYLLAISRVLAGLVIQ
jgi:hypothetical protein